MNVITLRPRDESHVGVFVTCDRCQKAVAIEDTSSCPPICRRCQNWRRAVEVAEHGEFLVFQRLRMRGPDLVKEHWRRTRWLLDRFLGER